MFGRRRSVYREPRPADTRSEVLKAAEAALSRILGGCGWELIGHGWWRPKGNRLAGSNTLVGALQVALRDGSVDRLGDIGQSGSPLDEAMRQLIAGAGSARVTSVARSAPDLVNAAGALLRARALLWLAASVAAEECAEAGQAGSERSYRGLAALAEGKPC